MKDVLQAIADRTPGGGASLYLFRSDNRSLECVEAVGTLAGDRGAAPDGTSAEFPEVRAAVTGETVLGWEAGGPTGAPRIAVPVWLRGAVAGALGLEGRTGLDAFSDPDRERLQAAATLVNLLLENRSLGQQNQEQMQELLALQRIGREMTSTLDISRLNAMVVEEGLRLTGAEAGFLWLLEDDGERLRIEAWAGQEPAPRRESVPVGYGIPGWVARNGKPLRVSDRGRARQAARDYASRKSQLAVPLLSEGRVVGVLAVEGSREEAFTATNEEILSIFAAQAAKALEAARFFSQVRQERDLRDRILDGTPNGVVALDGSRTVVLMNQAARRFLEVREPAVGNPVERYLWAPPFRDRLQRVLAGDAVLESLEITVGAEDRTRHMLVNIYALGETADRGATLLLHDLTERRKLDERMQRMARLASIGQLAAGIAHEIRNPLTGVAISLDILSEDEALSAEGKNLLEDINREVDRLETLIRGLLDFARPQPMVSRPIRIAKALEWHRTFHGQCRKKGIEFDVELGANPKVQGDPEKLKQLFLNLAINALEVTAPGGRIRISAEQVDGLGPSEPKRWVRVAVEDTGPGMDAVTVAQIFNPFFTTKNEGTGLGLSIAHSIVEQHGGRIDVQSRLGAGTRFTVDLPALDR